MKLHESDIRGTLKKWPEITEAMLKGLLFPNVHEERAAFIRRSFSQLPSENTCYFVGPWGAVCITLDQGPQIAQLNWQQSDLNNHITYVALKLDIETEFVSAVRALHSRFTIEELAHIPADQILHV